MSAAGGAGGQKTPTKSSRLSASGEVISFPAFSKTNRPEKLSTNSFRVASAAVCIETWKFRTEDSA
jgi:hypothetical protein